MSEAVRSCEGVAVGGMSDTGYRVEGAGCEYRVGHRGFMRKTSKPQRKAGKRPAKGEQEATKKRAKRGAENEP